MPEPLPPGGLAWIVERARRDPDALALRESGEDLTFAALAARAESLAARLVARGVEAGDRIAFLMDASATFVALAHAAQWCGAAVIPINTRLTAREIAAQVAHARPRLVVHDGAHAPDLDETRARVPRTAIVGTGALDGTAPAALPPLRPLAPDAPHTILYTSGTTGTPKGVVLTNGNHAASAAAARANLGIRSDDRWLALLPLYHVGGLSIVLRGVLDGSAVVLQPRFDAAAAATALRDERITLTSMVATMLGRLLDLDMPLPTPALRAVLVGGGPVPPALLERARARGVPVLPTYGLTEAASQVTTASPRERAPEASAGHPLPGIEVRIAAPESDGCGEILVRGPTVMRGYLDDAPATTAALRDGWLHTGDIGRLDAGGHLFVVDRRTDLIVTGGENVYPAEVEAVLHAHPAVAEAAVHGRPDPEWGRRVVAAVILRPGCDLDETGLRAWCRARLAAYKVPRVIERVQALPRTASGKLRRHLLD